VQKAQAKLLVPQKTSQLLIEYLASSTILEWVSLQERLRINGDRPRLEAIRKRGLSPFSPGEPLPVVKHALYK
jgi:hypothetical protein